MEALQGSMEHQGAEASLGLGFGVYGLGALGAKLGPRRLRLTVGYILAESPNRVVPSQSLQHSLWGYHSGGTIDTGRAIVRRTSAVTTILGFRV